ncbi:ParB/RepB/Spo0J family partition protein (plasmid) [Leisingera aquaemixtae]|jgi:ParB family chromosome partitioning protein|uniref:ParB/RepB/Spo0J family partition protein n=1 Tax=Leisingera TaxID=191028 RepID=UPI001154082C|nr:MULTISPECIES: ParB N-terminal domain-containing protein [Leisingera]QDI78220.1 replication protein [Leisingera aquaemixtae]UWQ39520.1 ParB N-terminal domain-containing protein [Leisingera aquaemixtae]
MSKRRVFDIDFPTEPNTPSEPKSVPAETAVQKPDQRMRKPSESRRGPMATAISENADALRTRAEAEMKIRAENDRLAHEFVRLKKLGLVVDRIPIGRIGMQKLVRDRKEGRDPELDELKASIKSIGLSNPIRVEENEDGTYELIQGYRRMRAYLELLSETGDDIYSHIPAGLVAKGDSLQSLYRRMVDENLVRRDISFAEMAQLALRYAEDTGTGAETIEDAVNDLYASAGRQKRIYIRHFAQVLKAVGDVLKHPEAIPRALGLDLKKRLEADAMNAQVLRDALARVKPQNEEAELEVLRSFAEGKRKNAPRTPAAPRAGVAKTTLRCTVPAGTVRCQARDGKIEMAMERDFSEIDRHKLEDAIAAFFAALEDPS